MTSNETKGVEVSDIISVLKKRKWLIILPWILVAAVVAGGSYLLPPKFQSFAIVSVDPKVRFSSDLQRLLGMDDNYRPQTTTAARADELRGIYNEITSTYYMSKLAERLKLLDSPELAAKAQKLSLRSPGLTVEQIKLLLLQDDLQKRVSVTFAAASQVQITVVSTSPSEARDIANAMADIYVDEKVKQELSTLRSSQDFSDVQLQKYESQLSDKIREKTEFERKYLMTTQDSPATSEKNRLDIQSEIDHTNDDISEAQQSERGVIAQLQSLPNAPIDRLTLRESEDLRRYKSDLDELLASLGDLMTKYTWSDPQILNNKVKQDALLRKIAGENARLVDAQFPNSDDKMQTALTNLFNTRTNLDYLFNKKTHLMGTLDDLKGNFNRLPEYQARLDGYNREVAQLTQLRDKFKAQQESSTISQALLQDISTPKYKVVEPAKLALEPFSPNRLKIMAMGFMLGLVIGGAATMLVELLDKSFKRVEDVELYLQLPVLGVTPEIEYLKRVTK